MRHMGILSITFAVFAVGCSEGKQSNTNLTGDACAQFSTAFAGLNARLTGCNFSANLAVSSAACENLLGTCSSGDIAQLETAADCVNQIPGGDCAIYPNLAVNAITAMQTTCFANDVPNLSSTCQLVDAGMPIVSVGKERVDGGSGAVCPTTPTILVGSQQPGSPCMTDLDCAAVCCPCAAGTSYLAAACIAGTCAANTINNDAGLSYVCDMVSQEYQQFITGAAACP